MRARALRAKPHGVERLGRVHPPMRNPETFAFHRPRAVVVDRGRRDARRHGRVIFASVIPRDLRSHGEREARRRAARSDARSHR